MTSRRSTPDRFAFERTLLQQGCRLIAGVDEAGRGPLAGPVFAAAVLFPPDWIANGILREFADINDSKQLTPRSRDLFFHKLTTHPDVSFNIARVDAPVIDEINILQATHRAMAQALAGLSPGPTHVLVDGLPVKSLTFPQTAIVRGDSQSYSIAAASILAKVSRDRVMIEFDAQYPGYGFAVHKGYGTASHLAAIQALGPCPIHRRSFAPLRENKPNCFHEPP